MNTYGDSFEGLWMVMPEDPDHDGFGPFENRDEAKKFGEKVGARYAVNLTDHPDWFNVRRLA